MHSFPWSGQSMDPGPETISHCSRFSRAYTGIFLLHAFRNYEDTKTSFDIHRRRETQQPDDYQVLINEDANDNGDASDNNMA